MVMRLPLQRRNLIYLSFVRHPNQVLSKEQLYERNWGYESAADVSTVTVHIRKLREKIEREPAQPKFWKQYGVLAIASMFIKLPRPCGEVVFRLLRIR